MISGALFRDAIISGSNNIQKNKKNINELNIFPVPDGDTGTNMSMTIDSAVSAFKTLASDADASEVSKVTASAMLRGARGNSGVILSLLFRGISKGLADKQMIDAASLVASLELGVEEAYKAVMKPTEGTMLTVARIAAEKGREALDIEDDPVLIWDAICHGAYEALEMTPELLPVLKKAGVVDAGGKGVCLIFDGMMSVFKNGIIIEFESKDREAEADEFFRNVAAEFDSVITFTYCTEFIVSRDRSSSANPVSLRQYLEQLGDSVVVVDDEEIIKTHVHTDNPGLALQEALKYGPLIKVKIDNMKEQHRLAAEQNEAEKQQRAASETQAFPFQEPVNPYGFVSVAAGDGIHTLFRDLGCDHIVSGGQTMNPSTEDIMSAILATPAKTVFVLPNNKNILLAAEQTVPLITDRTVVVLPTRTIPQGISAMLAFDPDMDIAGNQEGMTQAASGVATGHVTFAARDSEFGGYSIQEGQIMGMEDGKLTFVDTDPVRACIKLTRSLTNRTTSFITLIYGNGITAEKANEAKQAIASKIRDDIEINLVEGNQPLYYFIVSVE